jgi:Flp pilus assembly protein TadG
MSIVPNASVATAKSMARSLLRRAAGHGRPRLGERGNVALSVAVALVVILGFSGLGVDLGYVYFVKQKLQAIADNACLAGSAMLPDDTKAVATAQSFATKNTPPGYGTVLQTADIVPGKWTSGTRSFTPNPSPSATSNDTSLQCTARRTKANGNAVSLFFGPVVGWRTMDVTRRATASYATTKAWDVTIVQDVSQSFSSQIANSRAADLQLLGCQTGNTGTSSQFGLVAMTGHFTVLSTMGSLGTTSQINTAKAAINNLKQCGNTGMPACSGSNMAAGLYGALQNFTSGYTPAPSLAGKAVVFLTDGEPNASSSTTYATADGMPSGYKTCTGSTKGSCKNTDLVSWAKSQAAALGDQGIPLYIIYYTGNDSGSGLTNLQAILASNAAKTPGGKLYNTPDPNKLPTIINNVCSAIPHALVD